MCAGSVPEEKKYERGMRERRCATAHCTTHYTMPRVRSIIVASPTGRDIKRSSVYYSLAYHSISRIYLYTYIA